MAVNTVFFIIITLIYIQDVFPMNTAVLADTPSTTLRLDQCRKGASVRVTRLIAQPLFGAQDDRVSLRLKELGFLPGAQLKVIGFGLLGSDPLAVQVNGTKFALRRAEAAKICVEPVVLAAS
jgi:ferrous iron transport protein A